MHFENKLCVNLQNQMIVYNKVAVFVEKNTEVRCETVLEKNSQNNSNNLKALETSIQHNNLNINRC